MYGISSLLVRSAHWYPNRLAVVDGRKQLTYRELNSRVNRLSHHLMEKGVRKGDKVGFLCENCIQFAELWLATQKIGAVSVLLNFRLTAGELRKQLTRSECSALFYSREYSEKIASHRKKLGAVQLFLTFDQEDLPADHYDLDLFCGSGDDGEPDVPIEEKDLSAILFTSGSTGVSKGVVRTHRMTLEFAMLQASENESYKTGHEILLSYSPMFHTAGLALLLKMVAIGGTYITLKKANPAVIMEMVTRYRVTQVFLIPPSIILRFAETAEAGNYDLSSVSEVWTTGGKNNLEYAQAMLSVFPNAALKNSYGATEFGVACSAVLSRSEVLRHPKLVESVGYISNFVDLVLVDNKGNEVGFGEIGEALISSSIVMEGYFKNPSETAKVLKNGWYHTNDLFYRDENGLLFFVDRKSEMIKVGGENVYPQEVETVLRKHPLIEDCAVVGVADQKWGEAVAAAIVVKKGASLTCEDVIAYCRSKMASYKKPSYLAFVSRLPLTSTGKVERKALKKSQEIIYTRLD